LGQRRNADGRICHYKIAVHPLWQTIVLFFMLVLSRCNGAPTDDVSHWLGIAIIVMIVLGLIIRAWLARENPPTKAG
jgi:hypothetical protein